jgi:hypothetical protein
MEMKLIAGIVSVRAPCDIRSKLRLAIKFRVLLAEPDQSSQASGAQLKKSPCDSLIPRRGARLQVIPEKSQAGLASIWRSFGKYECVKLGPSCRSCILV